LKKNTIHGVIVLGEIKVPETDTTRQRLVDVFEKSHGVKLAIAKGVYKIISE
jgi:hypothetical protein